jgi:hypothetical protein
MVPVHLFLFPPFLSRPFPSRAARLVKPHHRRCVYSPTPPPARWETTRCRVRLPSPDSAWFFALCWSTQGKGRERAGGSRPAEPNRRSRGRIINFRTIWFVLSALIHARICVELIYHVKRFNSTRACGNRRISFWGKVCVLGQILNFEIERWFLGNSFPSPLWYSVQNLRADPFVFCPDFSTLW